MGEGVVGYLGTEALNERDVRVQVGCFDAPAGEPFNLESDTNAGHTSPLEGADVTLALEPHVRRESLLRQAEFFAEGGNVHASKFAQSEHLNKSFVRTVRDDTKSLRSHNPNMARKPKVRPIEEYDRLREASGWYLAAYRDRANLSLEALADEMKTSRGQISDLENGAVNKRGIKTRYNRDWLEAACQALNVAAGDLLDTNPFREDPKFAALRRAYPGLSEKDLEAVKAVADTMVGRAAAAG